MLLNSHKIKFFLFWLVFLPLLVVFLGWGVNVSATSGPPINGFLSFSGTGNQINCNNTGNPYPQPYPYPHSGETFCVFLPFLMNDRAVSSNPLPTPTPIPTLTPTPTPTAVVNPYP